MTYDNLKLTSDIAILISCYLEELKCSLQDEYDNSPVPPEDRRELQTIQDINGVLEELKRVQEQQEVAS